MNFHEQLFIAKGERPMTNPFEDAEATYNVLINKEGFYSLWPAFAAVPSGWTICLIDKRQACLDYINTTWTDMRPLSLVCAPALN
jgi:MbtH protein